MPLVVHKPDSKNTDLKELIPTEADLLCSKLASYASVYNLIALLLIASIAGRWENLELINYIEFGTELYTTQLLSSVKHEYMTRLLTVVPEAISVISLSVLGVMTIFYIIVGFLAHRKVGVAYKLGGILYAIDGGLTALQGNSVSSIIHVILLIILYRGLSIYKQYISLQNLEQKATLEQLQELDKKGAELDEQAGEFGVVNSQLMKHVEQAENAPESMDIGSTMSGSIIPACGSAELPEANMAMLLKTLIPEQAYRYKSFTHIAKGGMGTVYSVKDNCLSRSVAMKQISDPDGSTIADTLSFIEEARVNALLEHPNIIPVYDIGLDDKGEPYYTMKRVDGEPLSDIMCKLYEEDAEYLGKFNRITLLQIFIKVCDAISFAHSKGIIHLDVKPENILVGEYGETLVMDWGISQKMGQESSHHRIAFDIDNAEVYTTIDIGSLLKESFERDKGIMGTPMYMAPEQINTVGTTLDERSDIYALGSVLYNLLTFQPPHDINQGEDEKKMANIMELLRQKVSGHYTPPAKRFPERHIPSELNAIVNKSMSIDKEGRYQSVSELIKDIMNFLEDRSISAQKDSIITRAKRFYRKNTAQCTSAALTLIFMTILGYSISFYFGKVSRASKVVYSQKFITETVEQSRVFAWKEMSLDDIEQPLSESDGSLRIPARRVIWFNQEVIGSLEMMVEFSWQGTQVAPIYIGFNIKDDSGDKPVGDSTHYFVSLGLLGGELCKLGKQYNSAIGNNEVQLYNSNKAVSSRIKMECNTRYRALIRHEEEITELYLNGTLIARNYDPMFLTGKMNGEIMIKTDSDSVRVHSVLVTKLQDPILVSPAKLADKLFALQKFDDAVDVYLDVFNTYEEEEIREEALYKAALSCYSLGNYSRFETLLKQFVEEYNQPDMADSLYSIEAQHHWRGGKYELALKSAEMIHDIKRRSACLNELLSFNNPTMSEADTELLIKVINALPEMMTLNLERIGLKYIRQIKQDKCLELLLDHNNIYSLNILADFTQLKKLSLAGNPIYALKPLSNLKLIELSLANTKVKDFSHIRHMKSLRILDISGITPNTFTLLKQLELEELKLTLKPTRSMAFLKDMSNLKKIVINGNIYSFENGTMNTLNSYLQSEFGSITYQGFLRTLN